jgi:hypothetical protein
LPLNNAAMNSAINQRLVMCESNSRPSGFVATATPAAVLGRLKFRLVEH